MPRTLDLQRTAADVDAAARHGQRGGTSSAAEILTEDIDQAILHFSAAVKEANQAMITRTVLFINDVLTSTAWHERRGRDDDGSVYGARSGASADGLPALTRWVDALESLTAAALPTALRYLRDLYQTATGWTQSDRRCSLAVLNLVFFTLVLCRQTQCRVTAARQRQQRRAQMQTQPHSHHYHPQQQQQMYGSTTLASSGSPIAPFLLESSQAAKPAAQRTSESAALDVLEGRVEALYQAQQTTVVRYLVFIAWNAESQLEAIKVRASVCIKGMPQLAALPRVPLYLSEHDGWLWLWMTATLYSTLALPQRQWESREEGRHGGALRRTPSLSTVSHALARGTTTAMAESTRMAPGYRSPLGRQDSTSFSGGTATTAAGGTPFSSPQPTGRPQSPSSGNRKAASSVEEAHGGQTGGAGGAPPVRSAAVRLLLQMGGHEGGDLYMHKMVAVLLSSCEVFVHHWTRGQPVIGGLFKEWAQRIVHGRLSPSVAALPRLYALFELIVKGSLEELTRIVVTLDDVVLHAPSLFFSSTRPLLRLHQLLEQLTPLQVSLLLLHQLHPNALSSLMGDREEEEDEAYDDDDGESVGDFRFPDDAEDLQSSGVRSRRKDRRRRRSHGVCADAVLGYCTAVSQLLAHVAELLLEPHTHSTNGFNAFQLPQSLCSAMLKNTMMFMAAEIMLHDDYWATLRGGGGSSGGGAGAVAGGSAGGAGREGGRGGSSAMRRQWRWWAVWTNTAHFVCVTGGRFGEMEESDEDLRFHQRRRDVFYVQAIALALEDVYALLQMIASTATQHSGTATRVLSLIFARFRTFFVRLHEEHLAAINLHVVSPFSALRDDTFNAFAQLLEHYVDVTAADSAAFPAPSASATGASLRRSTALSSARPSTYAGGAAAAAAADVTSPGVPPHRSLWLLAVAYLRLATIDSSTIPSSERGDAASTLSSAFSELRTGEQLKDARLSTRTHLLSTHNFVCATPFVSMFYLRDRSYESSEDWMQQPNKWRKNILSRNNTEVPQLRDSAHLFRCYRGEVQQTEDAARELLLLASVRLLSAALQAASRAHTVEEAERANRSASSFTNRHNGPQSAEPQAAVYVTAFSRYLCMLKDISSACLLFLLQSIREELVTAKERESSPRPSNVSVAAGDGNWLGEQDLLDAHAFELEVSLYSV